MVVGGRLEAQLDGAIVVMLVVYWICWRCESSLVLQLEAQLDGAIVVLLAV